MAKRFEFRLGAVLRVRRLREDDAQRQVAAQRARIARIEELDEQTRREIASQQEQLLAMQREEHLDPREAARGRAWVAHLRHTVAQRQPVRAQLLRELTALQQALIAARRDVRALEILRDKRLAEWRRDRARREQAATDEAARNLQGRAAM